MRRARPQLILPSCGADRSPHGTCSALACLASHRQQQQLRSVTTIPGAVAPPGKTAASGAVPSYLRALPETPPLQAQRRGSDPAGYRQQYNARHGWWDTPSNGGGSGAASSAPRAATQQQHRWAFAGRRAAQRWTEDEADEAAAATVHAACARDMAAHLARNRANQNRSSAAAAVTAAVGAVAEPADAAGARAPLPPMTVGGADPPTRVAWALAGHLRANGRSQCQHPLAVVQYDSMEAFTAAAAAGGEEEARSRSHTTTAVAAKTLKRRKGAKMATKKAPVVVVPSVAADTFREVPLAFAQRYRFMHAAARRQAWEAMHAASTITTAASGQPPPGAAPPARFFWRVPSLLSSSSGAEPPTFATLVCMMPGGRSGPCRVDCGPVEVEEAEDHNEGDDGEPVSPIWLPIGLLRFLPHFPLPSSIALLAVSSDASAQQRMALAGASNSSGGGGWPDRHRGPNNVDKASTIQEALAAATAGMVRTPHSLRRDVPSLSGPAGAAGGGDGDLSPMVPQLAVALTAGALPGVADSGTNCGDGALHDLAAPVLAAIPESICGVLAHKWGRYWAEAADPTAVVQAPYFFPYDTLPYLASRSQARLRVSNFDMNSGCGKGLTERDFQQRQERQRRAVSRMTWRDCREFATRATGSGAGGTSGSPASRAQWYISKRSEVLAWANICPVLGDLHVNSADTLFGSFVDPQVCGRHAVPLDECGNVFYDAIYAARAQVQPNLRADGRLMRFIWSRLVACIVQRQQQRQTMMTAVINAAEPGEELPPLYGADREWASTEAVEEDGGGVAPALGAGVSVPGSITTTVAVGARALQLGDDLDSPPSRHGTREGVTVGVVNRARPTRDAPQIKALIAESARIVAHANALAQKQQQHQQLAAAAVGGPDSDAASTTTTPPSPWLQRLQGEDTHAARKGALDYSTPTDLVNALWAQDRACGFAFGSPYWIALDTLEERWGLVAVGGASAITVRGRRYVNAEQTPDASRFSAVTCAPKRVHEVLCREGLLVCSWAQSAEMRRVLLRRAAVAGEKDKDGSDAPQAAAVALSSSPSRARRSAQPGPMRTYASPSPPPLSRATAGPHGKTKKRLLAEAAEIRRTENLWIAMEIVHLAGWTLASAASVVSIPRAETMPLRMQTRQNYAACGSSKYDHADSSQIIQYQQQQQQQQRERHENGGGELAGPDESAEWIDCVSVADITDRDEIAWVLAYNPTVICGKIGATPEPGDEGYEDWRQALRLQETSLRPGGGPTAGPAGRGGDDKGNDPTAARLVDRLHRHCMLSRKQRLRPQYQLPLGSRLELAFAALARGYHRPPPQQQQQHAMAVFDSDASVWVTEEFLGQEPAVAPREATGDDDGGGGIFGVQVDVLDRGLPPAEGDDRGPPPRRSLTLVNKRELRWPDGSRAEELKKLWLWSRL